MLVLEAREEGRERGRKGGEGERRGREEGRRGGRGEGGREGGRRGGREARGVGARAVHDKNIVAYYIIAEKEGVEERKDRWEGREERGGRGRK